MGSYPPKGEYIYYTPIGLGTQCFKLGFDSVGNPLFTSVGESSESAGRVGAGIPTITTYQGQPRDSSPLDHRCQPRPLSLPSRNCKPNSRSHPATSNTWTRSLPKTLVWKRKGICLYSVNDLLSWFPCRITAFLALNQTTFGNLAIASTATSLISCGGSLRLSLFTNSTLSSSLVLGAAIPTGST